MTRRAGSGLRASGRLAGHTSSILVATIASAFGVTLVLATDILSAYIGSGQLAAEHATVRLAVLIVAAVFLVIAIYVSAIVTANTFATIVAGRTRTIALLRLLGSSASSARRSIAGEGLRVGAIGAVLGAVIGIGCSVAGLRVLVAADVLPDLDYPLADPLVLAPLAAVVVTTWAASWVGSRRVLTVTPLQALGNAEEPSRASVVRRRGRNAVALVLFVGGTAVLAGGVALGLSSPFALFVCVAGGAISFTGITLGAHVVMPPILRLVGRALGRSAPARLASANALRHSDRTSRTAIGLVIGVTLITMFAVAEASFESMIKRAQSINPSVYQGVTPVLQTTVIVFSALLGFAALIAAVGVVNSLSLSVLQRSRELGLLRALGFEVRQVRGMILAESTQVTIAGVITGLILGTGYGWAGAQALLGAVPGSGLLAPSIPVPMLIVIVALAAILAVAAALVPARRALSVSPVAALGIE